MTSLKQWLVFTACVLGVALYVMPSVAQVRINGGLESLTVSGAITSTTLDTGQGANELYDMDQHVQTTSAVSFDTVTIGPTDGVTISDDGDGALIFTGAGQGSDENLILNFDDTANVVSASSSTGATVFAFGSAMAVSAPIYISQATSPVVDGATTFAVTTDYVTLNCTGAETINTITGGTLGMKLLIRHTDTECTIADDDAATATNAIDLTGTATNDVGATAKIICLAFNGTYWEQFCESDN